MLRPDALLTYVRAQPFRPFRIKMLSGAVYDIRHPEMVKVGRSIVNIFSYSGEPSDPFERMEMVGLPETISPYGPLRARPPAEATNFGTEREGNALPPMSEPLRR